MKRWLVLGLIGFVFMGSVTVLACGGYFSMWRLVDNRDDVLRHLRKTSIFEDNLNKLLPIDPQEMSYLQVSSNKYSDAKTACKGMDKDYQQAALLYTSSDWEGAKKSFTPLVNKGSLEQQVCVLYSLAKIEKKLGNDNQSIHYFRSTIDLVKKGAYDPLHLASSAYGQMGAIYLNQIGTVAPNGMSWKLNDAIDKNAVLILHRALFAYGNQLLSGGDYARDSINVVLDEITRDSPNSKSLLEQSIKDPFIRDFFVAYVLSIDSYYDSDKAKKSLTVFLQAFVNSIGAAQNNTADYGNLSAFAYQQGDINSAQKLAEFGWKQHHRSVDAWILAKISLLHNDRVAAQHYYHLALQNKNLNGDMLTPENQILIQGENALLTLSRGDFLQALDELWSVKSKYFDDIAYIAENILTLDELKQFADQHTQPMLLTQKQDEDYSFWGSEQSFTPAFRYMVARRLVREGHPAEAIPYFVTVKMRGLAKEYADNFYKMHHEKSTIAQSKATWMVAKIMRENGMELAGTQGYPDLYPGWGFNPIPKIASQSKKDAIWSAPEENQRTHQFLPIPNLRYHYRYVAADYAIKAADLLPHRSQAYAAVLCTANGWLWGNTNDPDDDGRDLNILDPQRSQKDIWHNKEKETYAIYVKNGALVPFAQHFGVGCPDPSFDTANIAAVKIWWWNFYNFAKQNYGK